MEKIFKFWPLLATLIIAWPLNTWSVVGNLRGWGLLAGWSLFIVSVVIANLELCYWWWFWGWLGRFIQELRLIKVSINSAKQLYTDAWQDPYIRRFFLKRIEHFIKLYDWITDPKNWIIKSFKWGGHLMIFLMGIEPFVPGARVAGVFFCRTTQSKSGFITLLIANVLHVFVVIWSWEGIFFFFSWIGPIFTSLF